MSASYCPRCDSPKPSGMFACKPCWYTLPRGLRSNIYSAFRQHGPFSLEWLKAASAAHEHWGIDNPYPELITMKERNDGD